ncbi:ATP-dependent Clp protease ATP-binding subunit, partial [Bacteroides acidifaciens]
MVESALNTYTDFHGLEVTEEAVPECVRLAKRYVKDRRLPDSAIDLLDRTLSAVKLINETSQECIEELSTALNELEKKEDVDSGAKLKKLKAIYHTMQNRLSPVLLGMIAEDIHPENYDTAEELSGYIRQKIEALHSFIAEPISKVGPQEVAAVVSYKTGIPLGKLQSEEKERLLNMENILRKRVVGQDNALKVLTDAILESRSGLNKAGQPIGSFFFLGPTGTGKTELAKTLAEALFNDEKAMIRFDMSEFKEEHSAALLYGAPPGYVGYEEGGLLVNKIRRQPYSVVLFDEIEKAHPSVYDIFLQIMDEGKLHDRLGKEGDFSNSIVLFTSNVGSEWLSNQLAEGKNPTTTQLMEVMGRYFRPEFLARLSEIVPFSPIGEDILLKIFDIQFRNVSNLLEKQGITIILTDEVKKYLAHKGFDPKYGARQVAGVIRNYLRRPISRLIISGKLSKGNVLKVGMGENEELTWNIENID